MIDKILCFFGKHSIAIMIDKILCFFGKHSIAIRVCPSTHIKFKAGEEPYRYQKKHFECKRKKCKYHYIEECNRTSIGE